MEINHLKTKILELGSQKNITELQKLIISVEIKDLTSLIKQCIHLPVGLTIILNLFKSFDESLESNLKRFAVIEYVLKLCEEKISGSQRYNYVCQIRNELPKLKSHHLVTICERCIEWIQKGNVPVEIWKDTLPVILDTMLERDCVSYNGTEMTGCEFQNQIINTLCTINLSTKIVIPLTAMYSDMCLTTDQHFAVVIKLTQKLENLECQDVPSFTYQLLQLCYKQNNRIVFLKLQQYFSSNIYKSVSHHSELSSNSDFDEISLASEQDLISIESTILYHIYNSVIKDNGSIKDYLNSLRTLIKTPEFILHPFQLTVLLMISTIVFYEEPALELIKTCIIRVVTEEIKKSESFWLKNIIPVITKTSNVFSIVIDNSVKDRPQVVQGLITLSFMLLNYGAGLGNKTIAETQWNLGTFILLKLMKRNPDNTNKILQQLCNRIIIGQNVPQLTDCLHQMCRSLPLNMIENEGIIKQLIEQILQLPGSSSRLIIDAVTPLVKLSCTIRDNLIILLRKALYSRQVEISQMAINGYLNLLKILRVSNMDSLSQSNSSIQRFSLLTQISIENRDVSNQFSNEAICLEVIGILRRCFMQQSEVKQEFYEGLYHAVCKNNELGLPVLGMLLIHFNQYFIQENEDNELPPLDFSKVILTKNIDVVLQEPIGQLIFLSSIIVNNLKETHDESHPNILRFTTILDSLCNRMAKCELIHFDLDSGRDLLDNLPECQTDLQILKQVMLVYEALMGYLINSWKSSSENMASKILTLFQAYLRFVDFSKNLNRPKKIDNRKKSKNDTKNKTTTIKSKVFKPPVTVLDFQTLEKILILLYESKIEWATSTEANILKAKFEFHRFVMNNILQLIHTLKSCKSFEMVHSKPYFNYFSQIASIIYQKIITNLSTVLNFDVSTAVLGVECFYSIINLIVHYFKDNLTHFLSKIVLTDNGLSENLFSIIEVFQNFIELNDDDYSDDQDGKKLSVLIVNTYTLLVTQLSNESEEIVTVLQWLKKFCYENVATNKQVGSALISLLLTLNLRCKEESNLFQNVATRLCDVLGTINDVELECCTNLKIINEGTYLAVLNALTNSVKVLLTEVDWMIQRCRAEYSLLILPGLEKIEKRKELLKNMERSICNHICRTVNICTIISNIDLPQGTNVEIVFKILMQLYNALNRLTKYFLLRSSKLNPAFQSSRFEGVLKLAGKPLLNMVNSFILHVEGSVDNEGEASQPKKKSTNTNTMKLKVLKETRLIPKLVYEMEQFSQNVMKLSSKTKIDLMKYVGLGISRDFRIKAPQLKEALEQLPESIADESRIEDDETDGCLNEISDANENVEEESLTDDTNTPPPKKKSKKS